MMLQSLHRANRRRTVAVVVTAAAAVVAIAVLVVGSGSWRSADHAPAGGHPSPQPTTTAPGCPDGVTCLADGRYRAALPVPLTVTLPSTFGSDFNQIGAEALEAYRTDTAKGTGVTVMEHVVPTKADGSDARDPSGGSTAASMATWLAARPFVSQAHTTRTTVDGLPAWRVVATMRTGTPATEQIGDLRGVVTFVDDAAHAWFGPKLTVGEYTLVDVPGAGVTLVWSWTLGPRSVLEGNRPYVAGISFG
jgi:hypothetical protein